MPAPIGILGFGSCLPDLDVGLDAYPAAENGSAPSANPLLSPPERRRHVREERAAELIERAARPLLERLGVDPARDLDVLMTNVLLPDFGITGSGAEAADRLGCEPAWILDVHNGGCASFMYMLRLASAIIGGGQARSALICNVQNCAGQVYTQPQLRTKAHAAVPGDGCGVAYVAAGAGSPVLALSARNSPASAIDMSLAVPGARKYWEPGEGEVDVKFDKTRVAQILQQGNTLVPAVARDVCEQLAIETGDVDVLVTNQPNRFFMRTWRDGLGVPPERHLDTFDRFGNLFGAGVPVTLDHAVREGRVRDGDLVVMAGFAHAGDFAAAAAMRWQGEGGG